MTSLARCRGDRPRRSASPCSVTITLHIVLGVIDVRHHRHDRGDRSFLRGGRSHEDREVSVARKVAGTANPVLNARSHDVRGIHVAIDVGFNHSIHADHAQSPDNFRMVGDFLRTQHDPIAEVCHLGIDLRPAFAGSEKMPWPKRSDLATAQQFDHAILNHFRVRGHVLKRPFQQAEQHGVGDVSHARLQRQQRRRNASALYFPRRGIPECGRQSAANSHPVL